MRMRKFIVVLVIVCYLIPTLGFSVTAHYCGGKPASVSLGIAMHSNCACGSKAMKKRCCRDKTCAIRITNSPQNVSHFMIDVTKHDEFKSPLSTLKEFKVCLYKHKNSTYVEYPPPSENVSLFLLYRVFRI